MLRKYIFLVVVVVGLSLLALAGCSSDGDGGNGDGGEGTALSFDGETAMAAAGGASIAVDQGAAFASVISSMLSELAADAQSPAVATKQSIPLEICVGGGSADLEGLFESGETASLTLTDCVGSPFGGTVNGKMLLEDMDLTPGNPLAFIATATLPGLEEDAEFTVSPDTVLTGAFKVDASITFGAGGVAQVDLVLGHTDPDWTDDDWIQVVDDRSGEALRLTCFEISTSIDTLTPAVTSFEPRGVLELADEEYTLNSFSVAPPDIGFDPEGATAVPISGTMDLFSGVSGVRAESGCGPVQGDDSFVQAELERQGDRTLVNVVATGADGKVYECTEEWENLLATLRDLTAFESCPCVENCGNGNGKVDVLTCAAGALPDFKVYLDELIEVLKQVDSPGFQNDSLIDWMSDDEAGLFAIGVYLDGGGPERELSGEVTPKERCSSGMETDDVCILKWTVNMRTPSAEEVAYGRISAVKFPPTAQTPRGAHRLTIIDFDPDEPTKTNIKVEHSFDCSIEVNLFDMLWRLRTEPAEFYSLALGFDVTRLGAAQGSGRGDVIWGSGTGSEATITFTVDGERVDCDFDLDTFAVSCP